MTAQVASIAACFPEQLLWIGRGIPPTRAGGAPSPRPRGVAVRTRAPPRAPAPWQEGRGQSRGARPRPGARRTRSAISASLAPSRSAARRRNGSAWRGLTQLRSVVSASGEPAERSTCPEASTTATWPRIRASTTVPRQTVASTGGAGSLTVLTLTADKLVLVRSPAITGEEGTSPRAPSVSLHSVGEQRSRPTFIDLYGTSGCIATAAVLVVLVARPAQVPAAPMLRNLAAIQINAVVENSAAVTALAVRAGQDRRRPAGPDA